MPFFESHYIFKNQDKNWLLWIGIKLKLAGKLNGELEALGFLFLVGL